MSAITTLIRGLSPFGPIFGKELRVTARRKRSYLLRVLYLAALFLALLAVWTGSQYGNAVTGAAARAQAQEQLGTSFYTCFVAFTTTAMAVIGPVLTATAISAERLGRTLHVLLCTPITTWQILGGKLASRLLVALTLIGLSLPVLALSRLFGGVELLQMFGGVCLAATVAIHSAAIGLFFSTILKRAFAVILLSYAVIGFCQFFLLFIGVAMMAGRARGDLWVWAHFNWYMAMGSLVAPNEFRRMSSPFAPFGADVPPWMFCCGFYLLLSAVLVFGSGLLLRRVAKREGGGAGGTDPSEHIPVANLAVAAPPSGLPPLPAAAEAVVASAEAARLTYSVPQARGPRAERPRDVSDNPVLWREIRRPLTNRRWQALLFSLIAVVLLLISYAVVASTGGRALADPDAQIGYAIIFHGLLWLLVAVVSATSVAQEKESDTWTLLLTTPITGRTIVFGKAAGLLRRFMWPFAFAAGHLALFTAFGVIRPEALVLAIWVMVAFNSIWVATGIYLSLRLRTVTFAVILNLVLAILVYPVVALSLLIGGELLTPRRIDPGNYRDGGGAWSEQVAWYLPYSYLGVGMNGVERMRRTGLGIVAYDDRAFWLPCDLTAKAPAQGTQNYYASPYYGRRVSAAAYFAITFAVGMAYLLASLGLLLWTARRFDRIVGRAPHRAAVAGAEKHDAP